MHVCTEHDIYVWIIYPLKVSECAWAEFSHNIEVVAQKKFECMCCNACKDAEES